MQNIVQEGDPVLRNKAETVPLRSITSAKIKKVINRMKTALESAEDGVAIAAPQIGESLRIFVVSHRADEIETGTKRKRKNDEVFINPVIVELDPETAQLEEGCLSVKSIFGTVTRSTRVVIEAYDEKGKKIRREGYGLKAQIFQHECDHLNGHLFIDKAHDLYKYSPKTHANSRIAFWGSDDFSVYVLNALKDRGLTPHLIITTPASRKGRGLTLSDSAVASWAKNEGIDYIAPEKLDTVFEETYRTYHIDCALVASYGKIIPNNLLETALEGTYNIHPSLLPRWRGPSPIEAALINDDKTGVTIIKLDSKMDHGPIAAQSEVILPEWPYDKAELERMLATRGADMFTNILPSIINNTIALIPQDEDKATYCKMIRKEDGLISLTDKPESIIRKLKAYSQWPKVFFFAKSKADKEIRVIIEKAHIEDGQLVIDEVKPEGKNSMKFEDFKRGNSK